MASDEVLEPERDEAPDQPERASEEKLPPVLPVLPLRNTVLFPTLVAPMVATNERAKRLVDDALASDRLIVTVASRDPENAPFKELARIPASRVPVWQIVNPALSPDGRSMAQALTDGFTTTSGRCRRRRGPGGSCWTLAIARPSSPAASHGRPTAARFSRPWRRATPTSCCWRA